MNRPSLFMQNWGPSSARDHVVLLHGVESHAGWFTDVASLLAGGGVRCLAFDRPGFGQSPGPRGHVPSLKICIRDVIEIAQDARTACRHPHPRVHLVGMSWGGLLAAYVAQYHPPLWSTVTLIAPAIYTTKMPSPHSLTAALLHPSKRVPLPIAIRDFTPIPELQEVILQDPHRVTDVTLLTLLQTVRLQHLVRRPPSKKKAPPHQALLKARPGPHAMQVLLGTEDTLIHGPQTAAWAQRHGMDVVWAQGAAHSLVRERSAWVADRITTCIGSVPPDGLSPLANAPAPHPSLRTR